MFYDTERFMGNYREVRGGGGGGGGGGKMLSASYQSASSGFRLLGKIPAGAITEQKREVQHPVERPYVNTVTKVTVRILIFCVPRNMGNV